jgi:hypothetical protein
LCFPVLPHIGRAMPCGALHAHSWRQRWREGAPHIASPFSPPCNMPCAGGRDSATGPRGLQGCRRRQSQPFCVCWHARLPACLGVGGLPPPL